MAANQILHAIIMVLCCLTAPIDIVSWLVLGILVQLSFGLLLLPLSLVWIVLATPLVAVSWVCGKIEVLRNPIGFLGIPWAYLTFEFVALVPAMGETESRAFKLMLAESWPFCWEFWQFSRERLGIMSDDAAVLRDVLERISRGGRDKVYERVVHRLILGEPLDAQA